MNFFKSKIALFLSVVLIISLTPGVPNVNADTITGTITNVTLSEDGVITWDCDAPFYQIQLYHEDGYTVYDIYKESMSLDLEYELNHHFMSYGDVNAVVIKAMESDISLNYYSHYVLYFKYDNTGDKPVYTLTQPVGTITDVQLAENGDITWKGDAIFHYTKSDFGVSFPDTGRKDHVSSFDFYNGGDVTKMTIISTLEYGHYDDLAAPLSEYSFYARYNQIGDDYFYKMVEPIDSMNIDITLPDVGTMYNVSNAEYGGYYIPDLDVKIDNEHIGEIKSLIVEGFPSESPETYDDTFSGKIENDQYYYVELLLRADDGYFFNSGINVVVNDGESEYELTNFYTPEYDEKIRNTWMRVFAKVKASGIEQSTLSFTGVSEDISDITGNVGDSIELPKVTKDGYTFSKWVVVDAGGKEVSGAQSYDEGATYTFGTDDCILNAVWEADEVVVGPEPEVVEPEVVEPEVVEPEAVAPATTDNAVNVPKTGDASAVYLFVVLMSVSMAVMIATGKMKRVNEK